MKHIASDAEAGMGAFALSLLQKISRMPFSAAEQRVIDYLLSIAEYDVAALPSVELASRTGTSRSTIDRLCKRLGYSGLKELRRALLIESRTMQGVPAQSAVNPAIQPSDSFVEIAYKVFHSTSMRALRFADLLSKMPEFDRLIEALRAAPNVQVFGAGASAVVALDLHQRLMRLGIRIGFSHDHHNQIAAAALMQPGDLAIAISYSGRTRPTVNAASAAKARGATIAAFLGTPGSPLEAITDIPIHTPPGVNLFGADAVMTRSLEIMFNEVLFHCLAFSDRTMMDNVSRIEAAVAFDRTV